MSPSTPERLQHSGCDFFKAKQERASMYSILRRIAVVVASSLTWAVLVTAPASAESSVATQNVVAISGIVTGNVQKVGFRAVIQKQAIRYNLAGSARNESDETVRFVLQGPKDRVDEALDTIREGTKKSSNVKVSVSPATVEPDAKTFTVFAWTSVSRDISHPYDLVFNLRQDNTILGKHEAKAVWLGICEKAVQGDDIGKCDKDKDDQ
jgi:acylphosphatase